MKKTPTLFLALALACPLGLKADTLQDWSKFEPGLTVGTWTDAVGTRVNISQTEGPEAGTKGLRLDTKLVHWGGAWSWVQGSLAPQGGIRFEARSSVPMALDVLLKDGHKTQVHHVIRVTGGGWERFELPLKSFTKTDWQDPAVPEGASFDAARLNTFSLSPLSAGACVIKVGPVETVPDLARLKDGQMGASGVQDFVLLEPNAYGPFADKLGSSISMEVRRGALGFDGPAAYFKYSLAENGWCGEWIRAGSDWGGQDWSRARALSLKVYGAVPLKLQVAFNDANQNAYIASVATTTGGSWETVEVPFADFGLNPYYQPPHAKKGAPLDLSRVGTFNLSPLSPAKGEFLVARVALAD